MAEEKNTSQNTPKTVLINPAMQEILLSLFEPAKDSKESNKKLNTSQIHECLLQVLPDENFTPADCYKLLKENKFMYSTYGEMVLWLLKEK